jgi:hypothetical protein
MMSSFFSVVVQRISVNVLKVNKVAYSLMFIPCISDVLEEKTNNQCRLLVFSSKIAYSLSNTTIYYFILS